MEESYPDRRPRIAGHDPLALIRQGIEALLPAAASDGMTPLMEDLADMIAGYEVTGFLARGGMGVVYRGIHSETGRPVAIKLLPPEIAADPEFEARFQREARAMTRLSHPGMVKIGAFGHTPAGDHYLVMEFIDGENLHQRLRSGMPDADTTLDAICGICDALAYMHGEGYVHRDIKPANVFFTKEGQVKLGDFGLAKLIDPGETASLSTQMGLTVTGIALGTPNYVAPEQLNGDGPVDGRADVYSVGVILYEMLTGELPRGTVLPPSQKVKGLDARWDPIAFKAMQVNPADRYPTAGELRSALEALADPLRYGSQRLRRIHVSALVVGGAVLVGCAWLLLTPAGTVLSRPGIISEEVQEPPPPLLYPPATLESQRARYAIDYTRSGALKMVGTVERRGKAVAVPSPPPGEGDEVVFVNAAYENGGDWIAVEKDGTVLTSTDSAFLPPTDLRHPRWVDIGTFGIAVLQDGTLATWGKNAWEPKTPLKDVVKAESGYGNAIALHGDGTVSVWGPMYQAAQPPDEWLRDAVDVCAGNFRAWVLKRNGMLVSWSGRTMAGASAGHFQMPWAEALMISATHLEPFGLDQRGRWLTLRGALAAEEGPLAQPFGGLFLGGGITQDGRISMHPTRSANPSILAAFAAAETARNVISAAAATEPFKGESQASVYGFLAWIEKTKPDE